ncbi:hypothetical protein EML15_06200 [Corynebacterium sp. sy017]|uniref:DUF6912 family protein n=1 Tax=unclassified Corynebacterium TaxID=2624378 RepID=UPI001184F91C|nr:hypothetical protein [Corynebacterium sp. SY003]MBP3088741.1 hypothetical protein [Corynebacterium sp. sy017]TSD92023.1 hypothetical protein ELY17_06200 [Corynebacterium sp. SY003]
MRVYLPATFSMLRELSQTGVIHARSGYGFAVTPALTDFFESGTEEEIAEYAFDEASRASLRLLAIGDDFFPHRRVVVSVDIDDGRVSFVPNLDEAVLKIEPAQIAVSDVAAIHIDVESSEEAVAKAIAVIDEADLGDEDAMLVVGDALDNFLAWYDPSELSALVELL